MAPDLTELTEDEAKALVINLLTQLDGERMAVENAQRRAGGLRKMIEGLVEMFPAAEDLLPDDLDDPEEPRPRGAEAVRRVLAEHADSWFGLSGVVGLLDQRNWLPDSSNPANAVRTAAERLVTQGVIEKAKTTGDGVAYMFPAPSGFYDDSEEPF